MSPTENPPGARRRADGRGLEAASALAACGHQPSAIAQVEVLIASASSNEPEPALAAQDNADLTQAATSSDNAVADVVNTNTGQPTQVALTPRRPDGQVDNGPDRAAVLNANLAKVKPAGGRAGRRRALRPALPAGPRRSRCPPRRPADRGTRLGSPPTAASTCRR